MSMISLERVHRFLQKSPDQRRTTARFFATMWLAKLPYAPHRVELSTGPKESVKFWWSYFPATFNPNRSAFEYWGDDVGDIRFLWKFLRSGMTFLDIGAHHGVYSVIAAKRVGPTGRVIAFEPSPRERQRMRLHLRYNGIESVALEPYALAAGEGVASLTVIVNGFTTMNSLRTPPIDHPTEQVKSIRCPWTRTWSAQRIDNVDLIKIDTEGGELDAFRGANRLLSQTRPLVICEVLDLVTRSWGTRPRISMRLLGTYEYEWFDISADGTLRPHHRKEEYPEVKNYLAVPEGRRKLTCSEPRSGGRGYAYCRAAQAFRCT